MRIGIAVLLLAVLMLSACSVQEQELSPPKMEEKAPPATQEPVAEEPASTDASGIHISDTGQTFCFSDTDVMDCSSSRFYGQDAQYDSGAKGYKDNGDGTVTDLVTGLTWQQDPGDKQEYYDAINGAKGEWRVPTIKELYSLMDFMGRDPSADSAETDPYIDDDYFNFKYGDESAGDRLIDSQWVTGTIYVGKAMGGEECFFGVNFADGRIKCYPTRRGKGYYAIYVKGPKGYGENDFVDNDDGTITDESTGMIWTKRDNGEGIEWAEALSYCEGLSLAGYDDWRLPDAKELQYIVDYTRSPETTGTPAIDPIFDSTEITNENGEKDWGFYWTSTTHIKGNGKGDGAAYIGFGRCLGYMEEFGGWIVVHGTGCQRSDPKVKGDDYPQGHGPQGDAIRSLNFARCVRGGAVPAKTTSRASEYEMTGTAGETSSPDLPGAPPQEAQNACRNKQVGSSCSFTGAHGTVTGTCQDLQGIIACAPSDGPPR